jgi:hypothetical protein
LFVTTQAMRLELASRLVPGVDVWDAVEVELAVPIIFLIAKSRPASDVVESRIFFVRPHRLAGLRSWADFRVSSVDLLSPPHLNGTGAWRFDPVCEVWECCESTDGAQAWVYVLADGRQLSDSLRHSPAAKLRRRTCVYRA